MRANPGPADLAALPPDTGAVGGIGAVPPEVVSAYVGLKVNAVRPLDRMGPESSSLIADKLRGKNTEKRIDTGVHVATRDNMDTPEIKSLLEPDLKK